MLLFKKDFMIIQLKLLHIVFIVTFADIMLLLPVGSKTIVVILMFAMGDVMVTDHHLLMAFSSV